MTILNRCIEWTPKGIMYEADPRNVEILIKQMNLEETKPAVSPGTKGANLQTTRILISTQLGRRKVVTAKW